MRWVPVVQQPRTHYRDSAELITPVFDGAELQCVWDRVLLDASVAADASIEVWCRASDECMSMAASPAGTSDDEVVGAWNVQPRPYLRGDGAELPWLRADAGGQPRRGARRGG